MAGESITATDARRVALVAGGSGLVGAHLLDALLASREYARVYALSRRPLARDNPRLANRIVDFERLATDLKGFVCQDAFCCLGTTLRTAGSQAAFRRVDFDTVIAFARAARAAQAQRLVVVSSVGAAADSNNFYLRVKGETERALESLGFSSLDILQPALLLGLRGDERPLMLAAKFLMPLANPLLRGAREGRGSRVRAQRRDRERSGGASRDRCDRCGDHAESIPARTGLKRRVSGSRAARRKAERSPATTRQRA